MNPYPPENVLAGARAILARLDEMRGEEAEALRAQLAPLLNRAEVGEAVADEVYGLLVRHETTRQWLSKLVMEKDEEARAALVKGFRPLPGDSLPVAADQYRCPEAGCDHIWTRRSMGGKPGRCPHHDRTLEPVTKTQ